MSRQVSMYLHLAAMFIGQLASSNLLGLAAKAFGWSEEKKDFWVAVVFGLQGLTQTAINYISQAYNIDGSKPGTVTVSTIPEQAPKTTVVVETKKPE